jgi:hypothetical protein
MKISHSSSSILQPQWCCNSMSRVCRFQEPWSLGWRSPHISQEDPNNLHQNKILKLQQKKSSPHRKIPTIWINQIFWSSNKQTNNLFLTASSQQFVPVEDERWFYVFLQELHNRKCLTSEINCSRGLPHWAFCENQRVCLLVMKSSRGVNCRP